MTTNAVANESDLFISKWFRLRLVVGLLLASLGLVPVHAASRTSETQPVDRDVFLSSVAEVETGGNARAVGRRGERGLYQFTRATWQRHSSRPFTEAHDPQVAYRVAVEHFDWLRDRITAAGLEPTSYRLAVAWNAGLGRALSGTPPRTTRDYARRVTNLAGVHRAPARPVVSASETRFAAGPVAPAAAPIALAAPVVVAVANPAPDVTPISFSLGGQPAGFTLGNIHGDALAETPEDISFNLAPPVAPTSAPPRRFIFATIGE